MIRKKLIEVALPLEAINAAAAREKNLRQSHPVTIHLWWARRPLVAARAVLFAQLVDDPASWPDLFPTEAAQKAERQRLFRLLEDLVQWENSSNRGIVDAARLEIARSHARSSNSSKAKPILSSGVRPEVVNDYLATEVPPVHDPFTGGGTIPLEAQRLGLRSIASDLNPVAVLINKALIEIPSRLANAPPIHPQVSGPGKLPKTWVGAEGLAEDVRYYGEWIREEAKKRIGHLYPDVMLPKGGKATVIAWLWARTVESPNPAFKGCHVPLMSNFWLSTKKGKETWIEPVVRGKHYDFDIKTGEPKSADVVARGTKLGRGANFKCVLSGSPIEPEYIKGQGRAGRLGVRLVAIAAEGDRSRIYVAATAALEEAAACTRPSWVPDEHLPNDPRSFWTVQYGLTTFDSLFTTRQLLALKTLTDLVAEAHARAIADAHVLKRADAIAVGDAIATYLALLIGNWADLNNSLTRWKVDRECPVNLFSRQGIPMVWDFPEANPFSASGGSLASTLRNLCNRIRQFDWLCVPTNVFQADARTALGTTDPRIISTDPPYYDNIPYADLSDFFYVILRRPLRSIYPTLFSTVLVPKDTELVASPYRHGGKTKAESFFLEGMSQVLHAVHDRIDDQSPATVYYAFKQSERSTGGDASTGWETFLTAILSANLMVDGTWPVRTELPSRMVGQEANALASSIVLACRKRPDHSPIATRGEFRRMLRTELPDALRKLQQGNIAPVDVTQASIGPGMAIFSRHAQVLEADGSPMTVRSALQLINEVLDEYLASGEGDFDADTRFAIIWYEQHGWQPGAFGEAETLAKARNVSVKGVEDAGIIRSGAGKVSILKRDEMRPLDYDPQADATPTVWEFTQHMIRYLEEDGEERAARVLKRLGSAADATRELAYRLYNTCERKKWAEDARSYNGLILAWPELEKLAAKLGDEPPPTDTPRKPAKKGATQKQPSKKGQQVLFEDDE